MARADVRTRLDTDAATGEIVVDFPLDAYGDLAVVEGSTRLGQRVVLLLMMDIGTNPLMPEEGNAFLAEVGRVGRENAVRWDAMLSQIEAYLLAQQQQVAEMGMLDATSQLAAFSYPDSPIAFPAPNQALIQFEAISEAGDTARVQIGMGVRTA